MVMLVDEEVATLERLNCFVCVVAADDAASLSDCRLPKDNDDDVIFSLPSTTHCLLCFFFLLFLSNACFLEGPSNSATSALSVPVGGGGRLIPLSRALRR